MLQNVEPRKNSPRERPVSRRNIAIGTAWAIPTLTIGAAAPGIAASGATVLDINMCPGALDQSGANSAYVTGLTATTATFTITVPGIDISPIIGNSTVDSYSVVIGQPHAVAIYQNLGNVTATSSAATPVPITQPLTLTYTGEVPRNGDLGDAGTYSVDSVGNACDPGAIDSNLNSGYLGFSTGAKVYQNDVGDHDPSIPELYWTFYRNGAVVATETSYTAAFGSGWDSYNQSLVGDFGCPASSRVYLTCGGGGG